MIIDGDIWLLFESGRVLRYHQGEQVPFGLENSVGLADEPVDMYVAEGENAFIYLADAAQERILVFDKSGAFQNQRKAPAGERQLRGLRGIFVDEVTDTLYILTQGGLFQHPLYR